MAIFIAIITPHAIWLYQYNFVPIHYALHRVNDHEIITQWDYIKHGFHFALVQIMAFLGAILLSSFVYIGKTKNKTLLTFRHKIDAFDRKFLWFAALGPFIITILLGSLGGWRLHTLWGTPLLTFWGLLWISYTQPRITLSRLRIFLCTVFIVVLSMLSIYSYSIMHHGDNSSANFPAKDLAYEVTKVWNERYQKPLAYVAGERYLAGYISLHSADRPTVYIGGNLDKSPWVDHNDFIKQGGIFVEPLARKNYLYRNIMKRYPNLIVLPAFYFKPERAKQNYQPIGVIVAILPPQQSSASEKTQKP